MIDLQPARSFRFGAFEADTSTGELRRLGVRVRLSAQPFQVLCMLLERPGELLTREEISGRLWPDGTFVDFEHGLNSAINRIREALGDTAGHPRYIQTLARRGYRFIAPVEAFAQNPDEDTGPETNPATEPNSATAAAGSGQAAAPAHPAPVHPEEEPSMRILASPQELPRASYPVVKTLFVLLQLMYLGFYVGALANLAEISDLLTALPKSTLIYYAVLVTAAMLIPVRAFLLSAVLFRAPRAGRKFLSIWPFLLPFDELWSLSPFLLLNHINFGLALACTALLVYSPFAQRSLVLMGAGAAKRTASP